MKPADAQKLDVGTAVNVRRDDGSTLLTKTRSHAWQLGHGAWVIMVEGISGGYDIGRVSLARADDEPAKDPLFPRHSSI